jgi:8-oxo-dGTP pyrophosphatase MutT (NUDIX family)
MYKVFEKDKCVYFVSGESEALPRTPFKTAVIGSTEEAIKAYRDFRRSKSSDLIIVHRDVMAAWDEFGKHFTSIEAAGGRVRNADNETLFIFRRGKWDLPKGKIEDEEEVEDAAIREVEEECGVRGLKIIRELPSTYHIYTQDKEEILKRTYWFEMYSEDKRELVPQEEEGITEVKWMNEKEVKKALTNTYESIIEVMRAE